MEEIEAIWSNLEPFEFGVILRDLESVIYIWSHLVQFGAIASHLELFGGTWIHLEPFEPIWSHLKPFDQFGQFGAT